MGDVGGGTLLQIGEPIKPPRQTAPPAADAHGHAAGAGAGDDGPGGLAAGRRERERRS